jgi:hypothetical protein
VGEGDNSEMFSGCIDYAGWNDCAVRNDWRGRGRKSAAKSAKSTHLSPSILVEWSETQENPSKQEILPLVA